MARLLFSPIAGGGARSATFVVDGRAEAVPGPAFDFAAANGLDVAFVQFDFPGNPVRSFPFDPLPVASLRLTDQPLPDPAAGLFDRDGDGRFERAALDLNPGHAIPRVEIGAFEGDFLTLSGWRDVGLDFGARQDDAAIAILGAEDANLALGAGGEELTVATAESGDGLITVAASGGDDAVRLQAGGAYHGQALVSLGNGDDQFRAGASGDDGFRILADPRAASAADSAADGGATTAPQPDLAAGAASAAVTGSADAPSAATTIFPPVPPQALGGSFALAADGGQGDDRFVLASVDATIAAGAGDDLIELGAASRAMVAPGPGLDTVILRADAVATVVVARGETGNDIATADTIRFIGASPGPAGATVQLAGYGPGASARIEPAGTDGASTVETARLVVADPSGTDVVQLVGVDTAPLDALSIVFV